MVFLSVCLFSQGQPAFAKGQVTSGEGILLVAFGTSVPEARAAFAKVEKAYQSEFPGVPIVWAFTSQIIRKKLAREGIAAGGIGAGLDRLASEGVRVVRVQSLHMMAGVEFAALARSVLINLQRNPGRFDAVYLGRPLLESGQDAYAVAAAVLDWTAKKREPGEALVLMGHGNEKGRADLVFEGAREIFRQKDPLIFMATIEGNRDFDALASDLAAVGVRKALLVPLMLVAGDHARNDLAGSEADSWASRLQKKGIAVRSDLSGLGEIPGIPEIFIRHTRENADDLCKEPVKP